MTTEPTEPSITCSRCGGTPTAPCYGRPGCHGFMEGCNCGRCQEVESWPDDLQPSIPHPSWCDCRYCQMGIDWDTRSEEMRRVQRGG